LIRTSVLTLVRDRSDHLLNMIRGLTRSRRRPDELIVAEMGGADPGAVIPPTPFPVHLVYMGRQESLPLAGARNRAAEAARGDALIFLDVDCVPGGRLIESYEESLDRHAALCMGEVRYLPSGATHAGWTEETLFRAGRPHNARPAPTDGRLLSRCDRYELFWSLSFAVRRSVFDALGGFDESFTGYGAEDTDLALKAKAAGIPLLWVKNAVAFHQHHEKVDPPLQHLEAIVQNARRFHEKWGRWPMTGWLEAFADMRLIEWHPDADHLRWLRDATIQELERAGRKGSDPY
jgi:GT2 family glycosyltransferase